MIVATIQITDHLNASPAICTLRYILEYKLAGETSYTRMYPDPIIAEGEDTIELSGLSEGETYQVRVARICCEGVNQSPFTEFEIET